MQKISLQREETFKLLLYHGQVGGGDSNEVTFPNNYKQEA